MTNTTMYNIEGTVRRIQKKMDIVEKDIQTIIEKDLETYLGIKFISTEYHTGRVHGGIIDTIGIDENGVPVIIEYKRYVDNGAAIQGLYYLAWLMDHKLEFELKVLDKLGEEARQNINWSQPRVICIANDFKKYVIGAVDYMGPNIELMQYQLYENGTLAITDVYTKNQQKGIETLKTRSDNPADARNRLDNCNDGIKNIYKDLEAFLFELNDEVKKIEMKSYIVFKTRKNFALTTFYPKKDYIQVSAFIDPNSIELEEGFTRDRGPTWEKYGQVIITVKTFDDLEKAKPLLVQSYNNI